jgi:hypothetical protein
MLQFLKKKNCTHTAASHRRLTAKNAKVLRPTLFNYITEREEFEQYTNELFDFIVKDKMDVKIHKVYDLKDVATAHEVSRGRRVCIMLSQQLLTRSRISKVARPPESCSSSSEIRLLYFSGAQTRFIEIRQIVSGFVYSKIVVHIAIGTESLAPRKNDEYTTVQDCRHEAQPDVFRKTVGLNVNANLLGIQLRISSSHIPDSKTLTTTTETASINMQSVL